MDLCRYSNGCVCRYIYIFLVSCWLCIHKYFVIIVGHVLSLRSFDCEVVDWTWWCQIYDMFVSKSVRSLESHYYYLASVGHIFLSFILVDIVTLSQIICHCPGNSLSSVYRLLFVVPACPIPLIYTKILFLLQHDNRSSVPESRSQPKSGWLKVFSSRTLLHTLFSQKY